MTMPSREFLVRQAVLNAWDKTYGPIGWPAPESLAFLMANDWKYYISEFFIDDTREAFRALVAKHSAYVPVGDEELFASGRPIL